MFCLLYTSTKKFLEGVSYCLVRVACVVCTKLPVSHFCFCKSTSVCCEHRRAFILSLCKNISLYHWIGEQKSFRFLQQVLLFSLRTRLLFLLALYFSLGKYQRVYLSESCVYQSYLSVKCFHRPYFPQLDLLSKR